MHIPFCASKCRYCDFYSLPIGGGINQSIVNQYIDALGKEWEMYRDSANAVDTVYIGGGTPSVLSVKQWEMLDDKVFSRIDKAKIVEWSLECNPESFTMEKALNYALSGVTRLTFGVQSLNDRELSICGRLHSAARAIDAVCEAGASKLFRSIGVDIIYALPGQTISTLGDTLSSLLSIESINHLSAYELTISENTPFGRHKNALRLPMDEAVAEMYRLIEARCAKRGMARYEVSNFAASGHESLHNRAYWLHKPYIGLGASAHSYWGRDSSAQRTAHSAQRRGDGAGRRDDWLSGELARRWGNVADANRYISLVSSHKRPIAFEEELTEKELAEEMTFLGLRHVGGVDESDFEARTGTQFCADGRRERLLGYVDSGLLEKAGRRWIPTSKGMLFADMMARELIS